VLLESLPFFSKVTIRKYTSL